MPSAPSPAPRPAAPSRRRLGGAASLLGLMLSGPAPAGPPARLAPDAERGFQLYVDACAACHGRSALGDGPLATSTQRPAPSLAGVVRPDDAAIARLATGGGDMPGFGERFAESDLRRILVFLAGLDPITGEGPGRPKPATKGVPKPAAEAELGPPKPKPAAATAPPADEPE